MFFLWIRIILSNKYAELWILKKRNNTEKGALNPLGWSETRKTKIHLSVFYPNLKYTWPVFYLNLNTPNLYLNPPPELIGLPITIDELKTLWNEGVDTYDAHMDQTSRMNAALMWTVNNLPAYEMLSRWSTYGAWSCPVCQD